MARTPQKPQVHDVLGCKPKTRSQGMYTEVYSLAWHILVYCRLVFSKNNNFTIYKAGNVVYYVHIHNVIKLYIFYLPYSSLFPR